MKCSTALGTKKNSYLLRPLFLNLAIPYREQHHCILLSTFTGTVSNQYQHTQAEKKNTEPAKVFEHGRECRRVFHRSDSRLISTHQRPSLLRTPLCDSFFDLKLFFFTFWLWVSLNFGHFPPNPARISPGAWSRGTEPSALEVWVWGGWCAPKSAVKVAARSLNMTVSTLKHDRQCSLNMTVSTP